jgi:hypothetical protein
MGFIDEYTAKCMLGPQAKGLDRVGNVFKWDVGKKHHFVVVGELDAVDVEYLREFGELSYHYVGMNNIDFLLKNGVKIEKSKLISYELNVDKIDYKGNKNKTIRNYMNRYKDLSVFDNYKNIDDVNTMVTEWSNTLGDKYFRDFSGKTKYFLANNYHLGCTNLFFYKGEKLVSFGVASPAKKCYCTYVLGKALAKSYPGLSEFTDMSLYSAVFEKNGPFKINMGKASGGLANYKKKYFNAVEDISYEGKVRF